MLDKKQKRTPRATIPASAVRLRAKRHGETAISTAPSGMTASGDRLELHARKVSWVQTRRHTGSRSGGAEGAHNSTSALWLF